MITKKTAYHTIKFLAILAFFISIYLTYEFYAGTPSKWCQPGVQFDCERLINSPYARIDGIFFFLRENLGVNIEGINIPFPVALLAAVVFLGIFWLCSKREGKEVILGSILAISVGFAAYLLSIAVFVLKKFCVFCLILDLIVVLMVVFFCIARNSSKSI